MAYNGLNYAELKDLLKGRFRGRKEDMKARGIKLNATANQLRAWLVQTDVVAPAPNEYDRLYAQARALGYRGRKPSLENVRAYIAQRRADVAAEQARQARVARIALLRQRLVGDPVNSFNRLVELGHQFTADDVERIFSNGGMRLGLDVRFVNGQNRTYYLSRENRVLLTNYILENGLDWEEGREESDGNAEIVGVAVESMTMKVIERRQMVNIRNRVGGFFPYLNKTDLPLEEYQIYTEDTQGSDNQDDECCLLTTLKKQGVSNDDLIQIANGMVFLGSHFPSSKLPEVAKIIKRRIVVHKYYENEGEFIKSKKPLGTEGDLLEIAIYHNHYFSYKDTPYTLFYIRNKEELDSAFKDDPKRFLMTEEKNGGYRSRNPKPLNSLHLMVHMMKNGMFSDYNVSLFPSNHYTVEPSLHNIEMNQRKYQLKEREKEDALYLVADCEADVNGEHHEIIAFGITPIFTTDYKFVYRQNYSLEEMAEKVSELIAKTAYKHGVERHGKSQNKKVVVFFHNVKYDSHLFQNILFSNGEVCKDNQVYSKTYFVKYGIKVEFRDSFKHFGGSLKKATETFKLGVSKEEAVAYLYHTKSNMIDHRCSVDDYLACLRSEEHDIARRNIVDFEYDEKYDTFNPTKYYLHYLKLDVLVLAEAMKAYQKLIIQITNIDPLDFLTISSIGHHYASVTGCYDGLYEVSNGLREFGQRSVKGGRVYVNPVYKGKELDGRFSNNDGVSLYPSSMDRLSRDYGLPTGEIKKGENQSYEYYEKKTWYIVKIKIHSIGKFQQIPCVSYNTKDSLEYVNTIPKDGVEVFVDKTTLNDYIEFQKIDYTILEGIYWDNGFNKKIGGLMRHLHNERCRWKEENEPLANMIKLLMNSIYGKTGQRSSPTKTEFIALDKGEQYIYDHFGTIICTTKTPFNYKITKRVYDDGHSLNYVASSILSMSKRIMNEIFNIATEFRMPIYYTDTDSIHMNHQDVEPLNRLFKSKYDRTLEGKELGQFHPDFKMKGCKDVYSGKLIALIPKTYIDVLVGIDEKTGKEKREVHMRIKGITKKGHQQQVSNRGGGVEGAIKLFRDLLEGCQVDFVMNPSKFDASFEFTSAGVSSRKEWVRSVKIVS